MTLALTPTPLPTRRATPAGPTRPARRPAGAGRGFVLSVELSASDEQDQAEILRVVSTLAELAGEWFPQSRARAVVSAPGQPARALQADRPSFRNRLDRLEADPDVVVDPARRTVTAAGRRVELTAQETALLVHLARAGTRTVPRAELLEAVWQGHDLSAGSRTIDVHVRRLRAKTGLPDLISTVWGVGYRINPGHAVQVQP